MGWFDGEAENFKMTGFCCRLQASDGHSESFERSEFEAAADDDRFETRFQAS